MAYDPMAGAPVADLLMRDALRAGQCVGLNVATGSMAPTFFPGDALSVDGVAPTIGDVAVAWIDGAWVTHRVIGLDGDEVRLAGDTPGSGSHTVKRAAVFGRVVSVHHGFRHWSRRAAGAIRGLVSGGRPEVEGLAPWARLARKAVFQVAAYYARADAGVRRVQAHGGNVVSGLLFGSLEPIELESMTVRLYDALAVPTVQDDRLWDWEKRWYMRRLPPPPARILLAAAGSGREASWLARRGYVVDAFEPARRAARVCAGKVGERGSVVVASYRDLVESAADSPGGLLRWLAGRDYSAVILGWGSLSHVLVARDRERVLRVASSLAPRGPLLASFLLGTDGQRPNRPGAGWRLGESIGRLLGQRDHASVAPGQITFRLWLGLADHIPASEIERVAAGLGRRVVWEGRSGDYPHVTLLPDQAPSS